MAFFRGMVYVLIRVLLLAAKETDFAYLLELVLLVLGTLENYWES